MFKKKASLSLLKPLTTFRIVSLVFNDMAFAGKRQKNATWLEANMVGSI